MLKDYLKQLYIFRSYLVKNQWNLSSWLRNDVAVLLAAIDLEIVSIKKKILYYKERQINKQISLFDD